MSVLPPRSGDTVGPWRLGAQLGQGGIAAVYHAEAVNPADASCPAPVAAVKVLLAGRVTEEEVVRFRREFLTLQRLRHPGIVQVYQAGEERGYPWIAMELVEGGDLGALLDAWEKAPPPDRFDRAERVLVDLCEALAAVHAAGVVHRDIKPGNILVNGLGHARLTDFGAMKDPDAFPTSLTRAGRLVGTVAYMAPEQILGESAVDHRADLYSLGACFYTMLTARRPIVADSIAGYLSRHLTETPRSPTDIDPTVPPRLERVCMRLLDKDPARRFADAPAVLEALRTGAVQARPIHGRGADLEALFEAVDRVAVGGVGGVIAVRGEDGTGRTRLLTEVAEAATRRGDIGVVRTTGRTMLADLTRAWGSDDDDPGTGSELGERVTSVGVQGEVVRLRRGMGERRCAVFVDDVAGAGTGATAVLAGLIRSVIAQEGGPLLVCFTAAPHEAGTLVSGTATGMPAEERTLGPLDREALRALLRDAGVTGPAGAVLSRRFADELGGLPAVAVEQLRTLRDAGWLIGEDGGALKCAVPPEVLRDDPLPLPPSVRERELAALGRLEPGARELVDALGVVAVPAATALLAAIVGRDEADVGAQLAVLARAGDLRVLSGSLPEAYVLARPRAAQACRESLVPERRATLHRATAQALLALHRRRAGAVAEEAAAHLLRAGDAAAAWPLLVQAAQRAVRQADWGAARRLVEQAATCEADGCATVAAVDALRLRRQLAQVRGETARALGQPREGARAFRVAMTLAREEGDATGAARAAAGAGVCELAAGRRMEARPLLEEAFERLSQGEPGWPELADAVACERLANGDHARAREAWRALEAFGEETRSLPARGMALLGRARLAGVEGRPEEADAALFEALSNRAQREATHAATDAVWAHVLHAAATLAIERGDAARALRYADDLEALADSDALAGAFALGARAEALTLLGETSVAQRTARELLTRLRVPGTSTFQHLAAWAPAVRVLAPIGEATPAQERLSDPAWGAHPDSPAEPVRLALMALALAGSRPPEARAFAGSAAAGAQAEGGRPGAIARVELDAASALARTDAPDAARTVVLSALARLDDRGHRGLVREAARLARTLGGLPPHVEARCEAALQ